MSGQRREARQVVLVPVDESQARLLAVRRRPLPGPLPVFVANQALCRTFGVEPGGEEAELAALQVASISALSLAGRRLVLSAQLPASLLGRPVGDAETANGAASLDQLAPRQIEAFFTDDDRVDTGPAAAAAAGLGIDEAWGRAAVQDLLGEPLLWHDISELAGWVDRHTMGRDGADRGWSGAGTTRIWAEDHGLALAIAGGLRKAGHEVVVISAGSDENDPDRYLVATPASRQQTLRACPEAAGPLGE